MTVNPTPVVARDVPIALQVTAGDDTTCTIDSDGCLGCWGNLSGGETSTPRLEESMAVVDVAISSFATCALLPGGSVQCWGSNDKGQIGDGTNVDRDSPVAAQIAQVTRIDGADVDDTFCAVVADGSVRCWGENSSGEVGDGTTQNRSVPTPVVGIHDAIDVSVGVQFACAVHASGGVSCWGVGRGGDLGNATEQDSALPVDVAGISNARQVSAGALHACALIGDGSVWCWGTGELGQADVSSQKSPPVKVKGLDDAVEIAVDSAICARRLDQSVVCWGETAESGIDPPGALPQTVVFPPE